MRLIRAVRELDGDYATIALYTAPDQRALFVREADEAVRLDDSPQRSPYLDLDCLERALRAARAEAAWVGWGFIAEDPRFAELCARLGIVFIGPPAAAMRLLGDKIAAKRLAEEAGLAVAPWSGGPVASVAEARAHAGRLGLPVLVKATAGGGGRGMRLVREDTDFDHAFAEARAEAAAAFGDSTVFLERAVTGARHIEVQIVGDTHGTVWAVGVRDCTIQRRHQKVLEEAPAPTLAADEEHALRDAAVRLGQRVDYHGAGTVEFLFDPERRTRLLHGGEHPPAGRAPGHRRDHRRRPGEAPAPRRRRRPAGGRAAIDARARDRGTPLRRGLRAAVRPGARARSRSADCPAAPAFASTRASPKATTSRPSSTR